MLFSDADMTRLRTEMRGVESLVVEHGIRDEGKYARRVVGVVVDAIGDEWPDDPDHAREIIDWVWYMIRTDEETLRRDLQTNGRGDDGESISD